MSLRLVRSPDAPKITITHGSPGRPAPRIPLEAMSSASCILHLSLVLPGPALTGQRGQFSGHALTSQPRTLLLCLRQLFSGGRGYSVGGEAEFLLQLFKR